MNMYIILISVMFLHWKIKYKHRKEPNQAKAGFILSDLIIGHSGQTLDNLTFNAVQ